MLYPIIKTINAKSIFLGWGSNLNYSTAHDATNATYLYDINNYSVSYLGQSHPISPAETNHIWRDFIIFDTTKLDPSVELENAFISIYGYKTGFQDWNVVIQNGQPIFPHDPPESGDYYYSWYSGNGGSTNVSTMIDNAWNRIYFNAINLNWINRGGITKLILRSSRDISAIEPDAGGIESLTLGWRQPYDQKQMVKLSVYPYYHEGNIWVGPDGVIHYIDYNNLERIVGYEDYAFGAYPQAQIWVKETRLYWNAPQNYKNWSVEGTLDAGSLDGNIKIIGTKLYFMDGSEHRRYIEGTEIER